MTGWAVAAFAVPALLSAAYYLLVLVAVVVWIRAPRRAPQTLPPISILKPLYGANPRLYEALRSHAAQDYPEFEILCGVRDEADPALKDVERLRREFPASPIRVVVARPDAPNAKAAVLAEVARHAKHQLLVVNDDDIVAGPAYLRSVAAAFRGPQTGLVTCLYRASGGSLPSSLEALGIATEFVPSVMVARLLGVVEFALGSTMALRRQTLQEIGGFEAVSSYLADDYQLGRLVTERGYRVEFASAVVETGGGAGSWADVWRHQVRWSRTIRVSRAAGYYGSVVTQATFWALVAFAGGQWWAGAAALAVRILAGIAVGAGVLKDAQVFWFWWIPLRDLFGFAVWVAGCSGSTVYWRGRKLRLRPDGRISEEQ